MRALLVLAVLVSALLPACLDDAPSTGATARQRLGVADAAALQVDEGAELVGVVALEAPARDGNATRGGDDEEDEGQGEAEEEGEPEAEAHGEDDFEHALQGVGDSHPGDGRAPAWGYVYALADGGSVAIVVAANGTVLASDPGGASGEFRGSAPIDRRLWRVDSDEASDRAAAADGNYSRLRSTANATFFSFLAQYDQAAGPWWILGAETGDGDEEAFVAVNATSGEAVSAGEFLDGAFDGSGAFGSSSGQVTALAAADAGFDLDMEYEAAAVAFRLEGGSPPFTTLRAVVTAPDGTETSLQVANGVTAQPVDAASPLPSAAAGPYEVAVEVEVGVVASYTFSWCAGDVFAAVGGAVAGNPACEALLEAS